MLFNSFVFLVFVSAFFIGWPWARKTHNRRWIYITVCSFFFYGWWDWRFLFLLVFTGLIDYLAGMGIYRFPKRGRMLLLASIGTNVIVLAIFKYSRFASENINALLSHLGMEHRLPHIALALPVGISFYTFQSMSYTIDMYRKELQPARNVLHFFAAISLFPHLVAGPIMRAQYLLPQLLQDRPTSREERWLGLKLIASGYFKKVVIADNLAASVNDAFGGQLGNLSGAGWWIIITMFAFQIYCDFSGYSDIARGLAKWMGYEFSMNFDLPYSAHSLREFWSRWHMSLTTWFRDYVYIPLGGSKNGMVRSHLNMWITMLLSGFWHGAGWTFVCWGAIHAFFLSIERLSRWPDRIVTLPFGRCIRWMIVLIQVWIAWVFFRAQSFEQAREVLLAMILGHSGSLGISFTAISFLCLGILHEIIVWASRVRRNVIRSNVPVEIGTIILTLISCVFLRGPGNSFIYFQF